MTLRASRMRNGWGGLKCPRASFCGLAFARVNQRLCNRGLRSKSSLRNVNNIS